MSSNKSKPAATPNSPDYLGLTRFLVEPFLDQPDALSVDCEMGTSKPSVWIRLAFDDSDRGRVVGRGGRNIEAIRTVLAAVAQQAGSSLHLEVYGSQPSRDRPPARSGRSRPRPKPKTD